MKAGIILLIINSAFAQNKWGYGKDNGPDKWPLINKTCAGSHQSPVAIWPNDIVIKAYHDRKYGLQLNNYDEFIQNCTILNDGDTIRVIIPTQYQLSLASEILPTKYKLTQIHFHWGDNDSLGSEHTIGDSHYPFEMHMVHAINESSPSAAVVATFFQIIEDTTPPHVNVQLEGIVKYLQQVNRARTYSQIKDRIRISDLLPSMRDEFFYYTGSKTSPPCNEGLHWMIFTKVQYITRRQIEQFRQLQSDEWDKPNLGNNFRPTQALNDRQIKLFSYEPNSKAFTNLGNIILVLIAALLLVYRN